MSSARLTATLLVPLVGLALLLGLSRVWQGEGLGGAAASGMAAPAGDSPAATPSPTPDILAGSSAAPAAGDAAPAASGGAPLAAVGDPALAAVTVVQRFCRLVDHGLWVRAGELLAGPWVWPAGELRSFIHLRMRSAELRNVRLTDDLVFLTRVRARLCAPSPLHDGINTIVFTLGRGGTDGGWLITAVSTSP